MGWNSISDEMQRLATKYGVTVTRDSANCEHNHAATAGKNIYLGSFDDPNIEIVAFFHELGHALSNDLVLKRGYTMSRLSGEATAWELGLGIAYENGYFWNYNSEEMHWARRQLASYIKVDVS